MHIFCVHFKQASGGRPLEPPIDRVDHSHTDPTGAPSVNFWIRRSSFVGLIGGCGALNSCRPCAPPTFPIGVMLEDFCPLIRGVFCVPPYNRTPTTTTITPIGGRVALNSETLSPILFDEHG